MLKIPKTIKNHIFSFVLVAVLPVVWLLGAGSAFGQGPANGTPEARALELEDLLNSVEGVAKEPARVFKTADGYTRFIMAPPSTHFAVEAAKRRTSLESAKAFIEQWRNLFVNKSPPVGFDTVRVTTSDSRSYVRYQQRYAGLDVFGAEMIVQVNAAGGVAAVISDIMRDTRVLDSGEVSLNPSISALIAEDVAIRWLAEQNEGLKFQATPATLMIFEPSVHNLDGPAQLVWQTEVSSVDGIPVEEFVCVDAHSGEIAFHYSLIYDAKDREIYDSDNTYADPGTLEREEGDPASGITDVDTAYDYLGDAYDFYDDYHSRDSIDDNGMTLSSTVRFCHWMYPCPLENAFWWKERMYFGDGFVVDDVAGHELTHGVTDYTSELVYSYESGAINESFSDMWGEWIDQVNGDGNDTAGVKWLLGEDVPVIGAIRDMADPPQYSTWYGGPMPDRYNSPNWYDGSEDHGGVHHNSGVGNKLCYLLTDGDTFNSYTISGMDISKTADLFYECQTNLLVSSSDYYDLGNLVQLAAINLGFTYSERNNVYKACRAVEIYNATSGFYVQNSSGVPVAWFDNLGNLVLKGSLTEDTTPTATGADEFRVKNSSGSDVAIIVSTNGNMSIKGSLYEEQGTLNPSGSSDDFVIKNSSGSVVAYIAESGNVYLKGKLYEN
ncbi:MAG: hypothetical protein GWN00_22070 [Aliifodinibius sp.]|nr:M4 family metallopeptidase [Phycisphaerae bacterium]NIT58808.1 M4 family metallopeptidase [Fodinibius sp.]NIV13653.1 hypothetical protein [Fodinibius sp.]NIY27391.1 hypothetical protein [Fodinibius sp.]